jgi:hypothetical protein
MNQSMRLWTHGSRINDFQQNARKKYGCGPGHRCYQAPVNERSASLTQGFGPVASPARDLRVKSSHPRPDMAEDKAFTDAVYTVQDIAVNGVPCEPGRGVFLLALTMPHGECRPWFHLRIAKLLRTYLADWQASLESQTAAA